MITYESGESTAAADCSNYTNDSKLHLRVALSDNVYSLPGVLITHNIEQLPWVINTPGSALFSQFTDH